MLPAIENATKNCDFSTPGKKKTGFFDRGFFSR
jgi:hypothetical protein